MTARGFAAILFEVEAAAAAIDKPVRFQTMEDLLCAAEAAYEAGDGPGCRAHFVALAAAALHVAREVDVDAAESAAAAAALRADDAGLSEIRAHVEGTLARAGLTIDDACRVVKIVRVQEV